MSEIDLIVDQGDGDPLSVFEIMQRFQMDGSCERTIKKALVLLAKSLEPTQPAARPRCPEHNVEMGRNKEKWVCYERDCTWMLIDPPAAATPAASDYNRALQDTLDYVTGADAEQRARLNAEIANFRQQYSRVRPTWFTEKGAWFSVAADIDRLCYLLEQRIAAALPAPDATMDAVLSSAYSALTYVYYREKSALTEDTQRHVYDAICAVERARKRTGQRCSQGQTK